MQTVIKKDCHYRPQKIWWFILLRRIMLLLDKNLRKTNFKGFGNCVLFVVSRIQFVGNQCFWWKGYNSGTFDSLGYILPKESDLSFYWFYLLKQSFFSTCNLDLSTSLVWFNFKPMHYFFLRYCIQIQILYL